MRRKTSKGEGKGEGREGQKLLRGQGGRSISSPPDGNPTGKKGKSEGRKGEGR